jgi:(1->4)-alpha-D-glucan 1-alpha-D-glucosylmutase
MQKASRESKRQTSWNNPNERYERDLENFVLGVLGDARTGEAVGALARTIAERGYIHSLTQVVLKFTTPGIPDLYQGCELGDLSLVDPDNRNPIDYRRRIGLLEELQGLLDRPNVKSISAMIGSRDENAKFYFTAQLLRLRRANPELFTKGTYRHLDLENAGADGWLAYARENDSSSLLVAVPRITGADSERKAATIAHGGNVVGHAWTEILSGTVLRPRGALELSSLPLPWAVLYAD